jgi:hypothetical protein
VPVFNELMLKEAGPLLSAPVPMLVAPSLKVTLPVGVPLGLLTRGVKVTVCPHATSPALALMSHPNSKYSLCEYRAQAF